MGGLRYCLLAFENLVLGGFVVTIYLPSSAGGNKVLWPEEKASAPELYETGRMGMESTCMLSVHCIFADDCQSVRLISSLMPGT